MGFKIFTEIGNRAFFAFGSSCDTNIPAVEDKPMMSDGYCLFREILD